MVRLTKEKRTNNKGAKQKTQSESNLKGESLAQGDGKKRNQMNVCVHHQLKHETPDYYIFNE